MWFGGDYYYYRVVAEKPGQRTTSNKVDTEDDLTATIDDLICSGFEAKNIAITLIKSEDK